MLEARLAHASLLVSDLTQALGFYCGLLGFGLDERPDLGFPGAWLSLGRGQQIHLLAVLADAPMASDRLPGRDRHVALIVAELVALRARIEAAGLAVTGSRSGRPAFFCRDPDGNVLEFIAADPDG